MITGLVSLLGGVDFSEYAEARSATYGPLIVTRWFPGWWGISPWASPFWTAEVREDAA